MRTVVGLALITKLITAVLRLAGTLLIAPVRAVALVTPGLGGGVARRVVAGVGGGAAITALLLARAHAAGWEGVPTGVTDRVDAFVAAGRRAIGRSAAASNVDVRPRVVTRLTSRSRGTVPGVVGGTSRPGAPVTPQDTSLEALLAAARQAADAEQYPQRVRPR